MAEVRLQAGAGKAEISFAQEDFPLKAFTGIHDPIHVRVLVLEEEFRLAFVSVELTSLPPEAIGRFRKACGQAAGVDEEHVFVSVTHTFSAPHIPPHIGNGQEKRLSDVLYERILAAMEKAAKQAGESLADAAVSYGETGCCLNVNRNVETPEGWWTGRNEDGYSDHTVRVLQLWHGKTAFACLVNYDIQPAVMDKSESASGGRLISGDLAGAACRALERENPAVTAFFLPGCAGDQAPVVQAVRTEKDGSVRDLHEAGFVLAEELGVYLAERVRAADAVSCGTGIRMAAATALLPEQKMKYPTKELRPHRSFDFTLTGAQVPVPVTLIALGEAKLLFTTPELNSRFGARIREAAGERLLIGTLVNGGVKYLPEVEDYEKITYEAMNTKLGPGSAEAFLETVYTISRRGD